MPRWRAQNLDALYQKAKAEGSIVLYAGGPTAPWDTAAKDFSARYPGVSVSVTGGFSNVLDAKIDAQLKSGKLEVDLALFQTLQDFARWKQEGRLLNYKPPGFEKIGRSFVDAGGAYMGVQINAHVYAYNPNLVKPEDVPRSALDFLQPRFKGKVVSCYPADDDATLYAFYSIVQKYGWKYMDRYMANEPRFIQGHLGRTRRRSSKPPRIRTPQNFSSPGTSHPSSRPKQGTGRPAPTSRRRTVGSPSSPTRSSTTTANSSLTRSSWPSCVNASRSIPGR